MSRVNREPNDNKCLRKNLKICRTRWKCPPNFAMNSNWHVAAAEESQEVKTQNCREANVKEAFYLHPSAIPPNPSVATDAYDGYLDDTQVPVIPLKPIEEEQEEEPYIEAPSEASMELQPLDLPQATLKPEHRDTPLNNLPGIAKPDTITKPGVNADAAAAAAAAYTAILKCKEQGSLIDPDLLISILSNPDLIKKLIVEHGFSEDILKETASMVKDVISPNLDGKSKASDVCVVSTSNSTNIPSKIEQPNMATPLVPLFCEKKEIGEPSSSGCGTLSRPMIVTGTNEPSLPQNVGAPPFSWTPSVPFTRCKSNEMMIDNLINELRGRAGTGSSERVEAKPVVTSKSDFLECKQLISQFSYNKQGILGPDVPKASSHMVPQSVHQNGPLMAITAGTGISLRPQFPNSSFQLGPIQNACPNGPSMATNAGTGLPPRPDFLNSNFHFVHPQNIIPNAPLVAMTARPGTSPRPDISNLHSVPHNVPQFEPSMSNIFPSMRPMEYFKSLIRKHGNEQGAVNIDGHQVPLTSIQKSSFGKPHCKFFSKPRGCKKGEECPFLHIVENLPNDGRLLQETPYSKRMKLNGDFCIKN